MEPKRYPPLPTTTATRPVETAPLVAPYRELALVQPPAPRRVPWHVRALAWAFRVAWRAGSPFDPWEQKVCRRAAGGEWERRRVWRLRPHFVDVDLWFPRRVEITLEYTVIEREVWP